MANKDYRARWRAAEVIEQIRGYAGGLANDKAELPVTLIDQINTAEEFHAQLVADIVQLSMLCSSDPMDDIANLSHELGQIENNQQKLDHLKEVLKIKYGTALRTQRPANKPAR